MKRCDQRRSAAEEPRIVWQRKGYALSRIAVEELRIDAQCKGVAGRRVGLQRKIYARCSVTTTRTATEWRSNLLSSPAMAWHRNDLQRRSLATISKGKAQNRPVKSGYGLAEIGNAVEMKCNTRPATAMRSCALTSKAKESPVRCAIPNRAKGRISTTRYCVPVDIITHQQGKGKG